MLADELYCKSKCNRCHKHFHHLQKGSVSLHCLFSRIIYYFHTRPTVQYAEIVQCERNRNKFSV